MPVTTPFALAVSVDKDQTPQNTFKIFFALDALLKLSLKISTFGS